MHGTLVLATASAVSKPPESPRLGSRTGSVHYQNGFPLRYTHLPQRPRMLFGRRRDEQPDALSLRWLPPTLERTLTGCCLPRPVLRFFCSAHLL